MPFLLHILQHPYPRADEPGGPRHPGASVGKSFSSGPGCLAWVRARGTSCPAKEKSVVCYRASKSKSVRSLRPGPTPSPISQMEGQRRGDFMKVTQQVSLGN